jgi:hypothetical protein
MTQETSEVVRRQVVVGVPIDQAFLQFTERFGDFKPREHNLLRVPIAETVFEPRVGGHILDHGQHTVITSPHGASPADVRVATQSPRRAAATGHAPRCTHLARYPRTRLP